MTTTYTPNSSLRKPASSDRTWDVPLNANTDILDGVSAIGALCVATAETPSTTLNVKVSAGSFRKADGTVVTYAGTSSQACTASSTNYLYLTDSGTLTVNTTGFPAATNLVPLATVVAGTTTITTVTDSRRPFSSFGASFGGSFLALSGGTFTDGSGVVSVGLGATNGTKIGIGGDKLGFLGATPVVQQANSVDLGSVLSTFGLRASGGNPPLNLGSGTLTCGAANVGGTLTHTDATNVAFGTTTGTKLGTATSQKLSLWNATPVIQPASANQAAIGTFATVTLTNSTGGTPSTTLAAISDTPTANALASLAAQINNVVTDHATIKTLLNQIRADLVAIGALKGSA